MSRASRFDDEKSTASSPPPMARPFFSSPPHSSYDFITNDIRYVFRLIYLTMFTGRREREGEGEWSSPSSTSIALLVTF